MRSILAGGLLILMTGCGPEQELPKGQPTSTEPARSTTDLPPDTSDPAAVKIIDRCLSVMTDGHSERVEKAKCSRLELNGSLWKGDSWLESKRTHQCVWPGRHRVDIDIKGDQPMTFCLDGDSFWVKRGTTIQTDPQFHRLAPVIQVDFVGQYWMYFLLPVRDSGAIAYSPGSGMMADRPVDTVKVAVVGCPVFKISFDRATGLMARIEYTHEEYGIGIQHKVLMLSEPKVFEGIRLPSKIVLAKQGRDLENWTVEKWEFPERIEDGVFKAK